MLLVFLRTEIGKKHYAKASENIYLAIPTAQNCYEELIVTGTQSGLSELRHPGEKQE